MSREHDDSGPSSELLQRLRALRRDLHRHPELGFEEHRTQGVVRAFLDRLGIDSRACAGTGLVADLGSDRAGRTIALRADLDALPMPEHTELPHRSVHDGRAHKCGHDGHTAILLGAAALLAGTELRGRVRLLFQPAEEGVRGGGARVMLAEGALAGVDEVYGLHNWPGFPKGEVRVAAGPVMAAVQTVRIQLHGEGGHGSEPERCRDPIAAAAQCVTALYSIPARNVGHRGGVVLSVCSLQAGTTHNVVPRTATLLGTLRSFDREVGARVVARIHEVVRGIASAMGVACEVEVEPGYPVLVNDAACAGHVADAARTVLGAGGVSDAGLPLAAAEDFAYFTESVPGAYFFLGAGAPVGTTPSCHHPDYDFDDDLLDTGARVFARLALDRLDRAS